VTMKSVVIESPFAGDVELNLRYVRAAMHDCIVNHNEAPYASHALYTQEGVLDDDIPKERTLGIEAGFVYRDLTSKTVVYADLGVSKGMKYGIKHAEESGHPIEYRTLPESLMSWVRKDTTLELSDDSSNLKEEAGYLPSLVETWKDLNYRIDADYETDYTHIEGCDGCYCSCSTIHDAHVSEVGPLTLFHLVDEYYVMGSDKEKSQFHKLLAWRFLSCCFRKLDVKSMFSVSVVQGYYGDEIGDINMDSLTTWDTLDKELAAFNSISTSNKVRHLLTREYGLLSPNASNVKKWTLKQIPTKSVVFEKETIPYSENPYTILFLHQKQVPMPGIICIPAGKKYTLIDGHHRFSCILSYREEEGRSRAWPKVWAIVPG